ncbi:hypothetical protein [Gudongella sp. SC589]|uniref:hypothetical protein n=1 Tax=Gudongella sp. SC589 TaxID=3385990 RepID=UPI0039048398
MNGITTMIMNFLVVILVFFTQLHLYKSSEHMSKCLTCSFSLTMAVLLALLNFSMASSETSLEKLFTLYPLMIALFAFYLRWKKGRLTMFIRFIFSMAVLTGLIDYLTYSL